MTQPPMTSSIEVSEAMIEAGQKISRERFKNAPVHAQDFREIYLAMKAAEPLPQGDEGRFTTDEIITRLDVLSIHFPQGTVGRQTCDLARNRLAALVRSKLPIDRDIERLGEALFNLSDKMRASGILSASEAVHEAYERVVAEFTAIGSQSIEGEK